MLSGVLSTPEGLVIFEKSCLPSAVPAADVDEVEGVVPPPKAVEPIPPPPPAPIAVAAADCVLVNAALSLVEYCCCWCWIFVATPLLLPVCCV